MNTKQIGKGAAPANAFEWQFWERAFISALTGAALGTDSSAAQDAEFAAAVADCALDAWRLKRNGPKAKGRDGLQEVRG